MKLFHCVEDVQCITYFRGVYHQVPVFQRGNRLYAKHGSGFIRLEGNKGTSCPSVMWHDLDSHVLIRPGESRWVAPTYAE